MRAPNPPRVMLDGLDHEQVRKVVRLALLVVVDLAIGREWDAYTKIAQSVDRWENEEKLAFASLLDSTQASTIVSLREAERAGHR